MNWKELLMKEIEYAYKVPERLLEFVDENNLDWRPASQNNWMTTGQLLMHICISCGAPMCGYITGDWGLPDDVDLDDLFPEGKLPSAENLPSIASVAEAKVFLAEDKQLALDMLAECNEDVLTNLITRAPWDTTDVILGHRLLSMVNHLKHHNSQLFYYLKLQGKKVNTGHLSEMTEFTKES